MRTQNTKNRPLLERILLYMTTGYRPVDVLTCDSSNGLKFYEGLHAWKGTNNTPMDILFQRLISDHLPTQACPFSVGMNPRSQMHLYDPSVFWQVPLTQRPGRTTQSSISSPVSVNPSPCGHNSVYSPEIVRLCYASIIIKPACLR